MGKQERGKELLSDWCLGLSKEGRGEHRREFRSLGTNLENRVTQLKHLGRAGRRIEVGGGIGMGKTCRLKDVSFQCMTKFTTN